MGNEEITNMVKILGLNYSKKYDEPADLRTLRYGKLMIMADQDQDGSHIKGQRSELDCLQQVHLLSVTCSFVFYNTRLTVISKHVLQPELAGHLL